METTVIIPTYNRATYVAAAIDSILAQSKPVAEIIVVDDASTDGTTEIVERYGSRLCYMRKPVNSGKSASLNLAIERAAHPLIWIMDDDDLARPGAHGLLCDLLTATPDTGFAYGRHERFVDSATTQARRTLGTGYWREVGPEDFLVATLEDFFAHQPGMLVRKSLYETVGPFATDLPRSQDYEMAIRLARSARSAGTQEVVFDQRVHDGARGPKNDRFAASSAASRWVEADQRIFRKLYDNLPLGAYLPGAPNELDENDRRRALVQRGVVMARKRLWQQAEADFNSVLCTNGRISIEEREILTRAFASKYGISDVLSDPVARSTLAAIGRASRGGELGGSLARGIRWRVRESVLQGRLGEAAAAFSLMTALASGIGPQRLVTGSGSVAST
jgi:hypothetical protein